jgi:hypothetical protein
MIDLSSLEATLDTLSSSPGMGLINTRLNTSLLGRVWCWRVLAQRTRKYRKNYIQMIKKKKKRY